MKICSRPFSFVEVDFRGDIYCCCPSWIRGFSLGNIFKNTFDEIWHSENAIELRNRILNNDYSFCNLSICSPKFTTFTEDLVTNIKFPRVVKFCHDRECNYGCITCRDSVITTPNIMLKILNSKIKNVFLPMLKNAELVSLSGNGDPFASRHYRELILEINKEYPNIKFVIHSNGSLLNEENLNRLGLTYKIDKVKISLPSLDPETYFKITRSKRLDDVISNLKFLSSLKLKGIINEVQLCFVVQKMNYQEMPRIFEFAESLDFNVSFWEFRNWGTQYGQTYKEAAVFEQDHPEFFDFQRILSKDIFQDKRCKLNQLFQKIISESKSSFGS